VQQILGLVGVGAGAVLVQLRGRTGAPADGPTILALAFIGSAKAAPTTTTMAGLGAGRWATVAGRALLKERQGGPNHDGGLRVRDRLLRVQRRCG